jgi:O-antigen/teichoic acid export membrane protein
MLVGLQRQVELNAITSIAMTARALGTIVALVAIERSVIVFFVSYLSVMLLHALVLRHFVWRCLPSEGSPRFRAQLLLQTRRFATGTTAISVLSLVLGQTDKILLSKLLSLPAFGYYSLASTVSSMTYRITGPVSQAVFPRLTQLVATDDRRQLVTTYHQASQAMTAFIFPPFMLLAVFSKEILALWTRDPAAVVNAHMIMRILVIGSAVQAMMYIPYGVQLAYGRTALVVKGNIVAAVLQVPLVILLTLRYGVTGAATAWLVLAVYQVGILANLMHRTLLTKERAKWYFVDILLPASASLIPILIGRMLIRGPIPLVGLIFALVTIGLVSLSVALIVAPDLRRVVIAIFVSRLASVWRA